MKASLKSCRAFPSSVVALLGSVFIFFFFRGGVEFVVAFSAGAQIWGVGVFESSSNKLHSDQKDKTKPRVRTYKRLNWKQYNNKKRNYHTLCFKEEFSFLLWLRFSLANLIADLPFTPLLISSPQSTCRWEIHHKVSLTGAKWILIITFYHACIMCVAIYLKHSDKTANYKTCIEYLNFVNCLFFNRVYVFVVLFFFNNAKVLRIMLANIPAVWHCLTASFPPEEIYQLDKLLTMLLPFVFRRFS